MAHKQNQMMMRPNSFVPHICIILVIVNYSTCAHQVIFAHATVNNSKTSDSDVPLNVLHVIDGIRETANAPGSNRSSFGDAENVDYAQTESSQRIEDDIVSLPNETGYYRYENSKTKSIIESPRYERAADTQDMCDTSECKCKLESKFLTVDCHFQQVSLNFHLIEFSLAVVHLFFSFAQPFN